MTPIKFLWYSLIGAGDLFFILCWFSAIRNQLLDMYRKGVRIGFEERKNFLDDLTPNKSEIYKSFEN